MLRVASDAGAFVQGRGLAPFQDFRVRGVPWRPGHVARDTQGTSAQAQDRGSGTFLGGLLAPLRGTGNPSRGQVLAQRQGLLFLLLTLAAACPPRFGD